MLSHTLEKAEIWNQFTFCTKLFLSHLLYLEKNLLVFTDYLWVKGLRTKYCNRILKHTHILEVMIRGNGLINHYRQIYVIKTCSSSKSRLHLGTEQIILNTGIAWNNLVAFKSEIKGENPPLSYVKGYKAIRALYFLKKSKETP